jgi:hypothetical protein
VGACSRNEDDDVLVVSEKKKRKTMVVTRIVIGRIAVAAGRNRDMEHEQAQHHKAQAMLCGRWRGQADPAKAPCANGKVECISRYCLACTGTWTVMRRLAVSEPSTPCCYHTASAPLTVACVTCVWRLHGTVVCIQLEQAKFCGNLVRFNPSCLEKPKS